MRGDDVKDDKDNKEEQVLPEENEQFEDLMSNYLDTMGELEVGQITHARIVQVKKDYVLLDIGDKAEGVVEIKEFQDFQGNLNVAVGDEVDVIIQNRDPESGQVNVSYRLARQRIYWDRLVEAFEKNLPVTGFITKALKTGVLVDAGVPCFLPASQLGLSRTEDLESVVGQEIEAYVIDLDRNRHRGVLSRRRLLTEERKKKREEALTKLEEGAVITGKVKSIMDFGVFVDLGGIDGLVPREEVSWHKHVRMDEALKLNTNYKFKILSIDREKERVTLSRRQLKPDPWQKIETEYPKDLNVRGTVTNLTNNCAYVLLDDGIEGRIHRNNLSWITTVRKPSDVLKKDDVVKAVVLDWDKEKRLLELGLKQISIDPWQEIEAKYPIGSRQKVKIIEVVPYGAFVQLDDTTKGLIHVSDMSYDKRFKDPKQLVKVGDEVEAVVLKIDLDARRINLGIKQLEDDPFETFTRAHRQGSAVTGKVKSVTSFGAFVELAPHVEGLLHVSQWSREKVETLENVVKPGDELTVKIIKIEREIGKISLSRRAYLADEERREVDQYRSTNVDANTNLGSLLKNLKIDIK